MRLHILFFLITIVFLSEASPLKAAQNSYIFEQITRKDGLSNSSASTILQDRHGFLWFGTQGGLNKYDGRKFTVYKHLPFDEGSLPHNLIQTMYLDYESDILWLGTYQGLVRFDINTEKFTHYEYSVDDEKTISYDVVTVITRDNDGVLWVGTLRGLNRFNPDTEDFTRFMHDDKTDSIGANIVRALYVDRDNNLWIGFIGGMDKFDPSRTVFTHFNHDPDDPNSLPSSYVMSIKEDTPGTLLLACWDGGLAWFDKASGKCTTIPLEDNRIYTLLIDSDKTIWAGTWGGGLFEYNRTSGIISRFQYNPDAPSSLAHNVVYSLFEDNTGLIWIGTNGNGINKINKKKKDFRYFSSSKNSSRIIPHGKVNTLLVDSKGTLWIGVYNGGLSRYNPENGNIITYRSGTGEGAISNDIINEIYEDANGDIWIGTNDGLNLYNSQNGTFTVFKHDDDKPSIGGNIIYAITECHQGNLWLGTHNNGITIWNRSEDSYTHYRHQSGDTETISDDLVRDIFRDSRDKIWIGTNKGLDTYNEETRTFRHYQHNPEDPSTVSSNSIGKIFESSDGTIWLATFGGGLNRYEEKTDSFTHYTTEAGLSDNTVRSISEDSTGRIWCGTSYGLSIFSPEQRSFLVIDEQDGLWGMEFNDGAAKDKANNLYFGSIHGVYRFQDDFSLDSSLIPPVYITNIQIFNKVLDLDYPVYLAEEIVLSHTETNISFEFAALDYHAPGNNQFAYMLEGMDSHWIYSGTRNFASYTNIKPGKYRFRVKAATENGFWGDIDRSLTITIKNPPWKSWWAYCIYAGIILSLIYIGFELNVKKALEHKVRELKATRTELEMANDKLKNMIIRDGLTNLYNRRYLDTTLERIWLHSIRSGSPLSMIIIDIDYFKSYNDNYGHQAGDRVLVQICNTFVASIKRRNDFVARYGGEEFCVVLPATDSHGAERVCKTLHQNVNDLGIPHEHSLVSNTLTVSMGVATIVPSPDDQIKDFFKTVDDSLYLAKKQGRNRFHQAQ